MSEIPGLISDLLEDETLEAVRKCLKSGQEPMSIVDDLREGLRIVGERFESKEYFLPDLIMSAEIFKGSVEIIEPHLTSSQYEGRGCIVMGTVKGDVHDIGKNIVTTILRCSGYEVHDIGVDQPPEAFVDKVRETGSKLVGLSGLLTIAFDSMKETVEAFVEAGIRNDVKIVIGGGPVNESVVSYTGADGFGKDPSVAIKFAEMYAG